jgi:hypothetical protein
MIPSRVLSCISFGFLACGALACASSKGEPGSGGNSPSGSEVAVSAVSGAINNNSGAQVAWYPAAPKRSPVERALDFLNPIGTAQAAEWSCSTGSLSPAFDGAAKDPYSYQPPSCSVTWLGGRTATSSWSGPFTLDYGSSCDSVSPRMGNQVAGCEMTRTTGSGGDTRSVTGPDGYLRTVDHDTNGAGTGWDSSVTPVPNDSGVQNTCGAGGCASSRNVVINGSHLTGTIAIDGYTDRIWDHTVVTGDGGVTVADQNGDLVVNGTVIVEHNLIQVTSTTTFSNVTYSEPLCCFPTSGSVSTTFSKGPDVGKTETLAFTSVCGESVLTTADGSRAALTLEHCL